ncbi:hypothetical protein ACMXYX_06120 [Neptuniibacter sp. QD72_48]|uniref:hypothetical protein n=1 Tax=unclassified Neptuniibacter TaxID=2630693 RepID=UPI0039F565E2
MSFSKAFIVASVLVLTACNSAGVKSQSGQTEETNAGQPSISQSSQQAQEKSSNNSSQEQPSNQLGIIANRMTAVQDHLLQIKSQSSQLQQQNQELALQLQDLANEVQALAVQPQTSTPREPVSPDAFNGVLDQITMMANELGSQVQDGAFRMVTAYTSKGQWVLIRFHRYTGESWLADKGQWNLLEESSRIGTAEYEVVLRRADKDVKGYVAARINRISGETWWLKQNTWQPYISN